MSIVVHTYAITIEIIQEMLGTIPKDRLVFKNYIQSLGEDNEDEAETAPETVEQRGWTGFHLDEKGKPILYNYMIKAHIKDAAGALRGVEGSQSYKMTAYKRNITNWVHVEPRRIPLILPRGATIGVNERPLRADTMQGPRVTVVRSDTVPEGTRAAFRVILAGNQITADHLSEWMEWGRYNGLGQWRGAGWGSFLVESFAEIV